MGTDKAIFAVDRCGSEHCAWPEVTWPEVTLVTWPEAALTGRGPVRNRSDRVRMRNRKWSYAHAQPEVAQPFRMLRNIRLFSPEVTLVTWPEETMSGSARVRMRNRKLRNRFPRFFIYSSSSTSTMTTEGGAHAQPKVAEPLPAFFLTLVNFPA